VTPTTSLPPADSSGLWLGVPESKSASEKLHLLVPNEKKRKNYLRLFKWVVSFATWRYGTETVGSSNKSDGAMDEAGYTLQVLLPRLFTLLALRSSLTSRQGYGFVPSPNRGSGGNYKATAQADAATAAAATTSTQQLPQTEEKMAATAKAKVSLGSKIYRQRKAKDQSTLTLAEPESPKPANYIPFSQRQSKSAVASYQAIKKRNKVSLDSPAPSPHPFLRTSKGQARAKPRG
jgi:hypothetical protein